MGIARDVRLCWLNHCCAEFIHHSGESIDDRWMSVGLLAKVSGVFRPYEFIMERHLIRVIVTLVVSMVAQSAFGHGSEPISQRFFSLEDGWLLQSNFGVTAETFEGFVCEEAFLGGDQFNVIPLAEGWVTLADSSIHTSSDGCTFTRTRSLEQAPADSDGTGRSVIYVSNNDEDGGIWLSQDSGESWRLIDYDLTEIQLTGSRFDSEERAIVSGYDRASGGEGLLLEIDLRGEPSVNELVLGEGIKYPYVFDARGGQVVWLGRTESQQMYWGPLDDPRRDVLPIETWPSGAVLSADGSKVWLSGLEAGKGLTIGTRTEQEAIWQTVALQTTAGCVGRHESETYVCSMRRFDDADLIEAAADGLLETVID